MCSNSRDINKETRTMSTVSLLLTLLSLPILVSFLLILNIFHILHVKYARIRALYWKKERKVISLRDCKLKCFSSVILACPYIRPPRIGPSNFSFVFIYAQGVLTEFYSIYIYLYIYLYISISSYLFICVSIYLSLFIYLSVYIREKKTTLFVKYFSICFP